MCSWGAFLVAAYQSLWLHCHLALSEILAVSVKDLPRPVSFRAFGIMIQHMILVIAPLLSEKALVSTAPKPGKDVNP